MEMCCHLNSTIGEAFTDVCKLNNNHWKERENVKKEKKLFRTSVHLCWIWTIYVEKAVNEWRVRMDIERDTWMLLRLALVSGFLLASNLNIVNTHGCLVLATGSFRFIISVPERAVVPLNISTCLQSTLAMLYYGCPLSQPLLPSLPALTAPQKRKKNWKKWLGGANSWHQGFKMQFRLRFQFW